MTFEELQGKINVEYNKISFFSFLKRNMTNKNSDKFKTITSLQFGLNSFEYVSKHPNTDLEKYYVKELLYIQIQNEVNAFLEKTKEFHEPIVDDKEKIIIGQGKYKNASVFKVNIEEDVCIDKNKFNVDDFEIVTGDFREIDLNHLDNASIKSFIIIEY
jgi:hypothetical protein